MSVTGWDALKRRVGSIKRAIESGEIWEEAATEWARDDFLPVAKQLCPVGETGQLRDSINYEVNPRQVRVFADKEYASFVEDGTSLQKAQPFMRPARDKTRRKLSERTRKAMSRRLK